MLKNISTATLAALTISALLLTGQPALATEQSTTDSQTASQLRAVGEPGDYIAEQPTVTPTQPASPAPVAQPTQEQPKTPTASPDTDEDHPTLSPQDQLANDYMMDAYDLWLDADGKLVDTPSPFDYFARRYLSSDSYTVHPNDDEDTEYLGSTKYPGIFHAFQTEKYIAETTPTEPNTYAPNPKDTPEFANADPGYILNAFHTFKIHFATTLANVPTSQEKWTAFVAAFVSYSVTRTNPTDKLAVVESPTLPGIWYTFLKELNVA